MNELEMLKLVALKIVIEKLGIHEEVKAEMARLKEGYTGDKSGPTIAEYMGLE